MRNYLPVTGLTCFALTPQARLFFQLRSNSTCHHVFVFVPSDDGDDGNDGDDTDDSNDGNDTDDTA